MRLNQSEVGAMQSMPLRVRSMEGLSAPIDDCQNAIEGGDVKGLGEFLFIDHAFYLVASYELERLSSP